MTHLTLKNVSVVFPVHTELSKSLRHSFIAPHVGALFRKASKPGLALIDALQGISLSLQPGDRLGLIGHNGSGKSTLLKVLAGVYVPTGGEIECVGQRLALFDLGLGISGETSGLDNIYSIAMMQGRSRSEISAKIDDIIAFSGLEEYIGMPVRTYSAGMSLRLYFSISTAWPPEILLLDEVMGAGDAAFFSKAQERMRSMLAGTGIVVMASHSLEAQRQVCNKGLVLHHGRQHYLGPIEDAIAQYESLIRAA